MEFELKITSLFVPFLAIFIVLGNCLYCLQNKSCDYRHAAKSSTPKFKTDFGSHRRVTNAVLEGVGCGEKVRFK